MRNNIKQYDQMILRMYADGYSSSYIADYFQVSKPGVIDRLRKYGVIKHTRSSNMIIKGESLKIYDEQIINLYKEGYSAQHIGKLLNINEHSVAYRLKINNIQKRKILGIKHSQRNPTITLEFFKNLIKNRKSDFDYFLGLLASDGNITGNQIRIASISDENVEFLEHFKDFLDNKVNIHRNLRSDKQKYYNSIAFKNQDIVELLTKDYGITANKTFTLQLPYINWDIIRGYFDGDGCLVKDKRCNSWQFEIVSASILFATQLNDFYKSNNLHSHIYKEKNLYKITILQKQDIIFIFNNIYKDCSYFLKRKYDKFLPIIQETE